jgi:phytoene dehydrogenase-like protein
MKISIIGAGVSGLSAGCYLQMNGLDTEIFEAHSGAGGLCTSWQRGEYTFDGCIQWLMGSNESSPFFNLWSELIDMNSIRFIHHETRMEIETKDSRDRYGSNIFHLYTDLKRLEEYLVDLAPEDESQVRSMIRAIRKIQSFEIPPMIRSVPELEPWYRKIGYIRYIPILLFLNKYKKITSFSFAASLRNPFLQEAFRLLFDNKDLPLLILTMPMALYDRQGAGYPEGGSARFAGRILDRYLSLGGKVRYNSPVKKIMVDEHHATGVELQNGEQVSSGIVVSAADWHFTVFEALGGRYVDKTIISLERQERLPVYYSSFMVHLGLNRTFERMPHLSRFPLDQPLLSPDGTRIERMEMHVYNYDRTLAPEGKTVICASLYTMKGDYWIDLRKNDPEGYFRVKNDFAKQMTNILEAKFGGILDNIEQTGIVTPATFYHYTGNWKGSLQGWLPGKNIIERSPVKQELPGLKNFYLAGHWTLPGGGLPVAIKSARDAAIHICHQQGKKFLIR